MEAVIPLVVVVAIAALVIYLARRVPYPDDTSQNPRNR